MVPGYQLILRNKIDPPTGYGSVPDKLTPPCSETYKVCYFRTIYVIQSYYVILELSMWFRAIICHFRAIYVIQRHIKYVILELSMWFRDIYVILELSMRFRAIYVSLKLSMWFRAIYVILELSIWFRDIYVIWELSIWFRHIYVILELSYLCHSEQYMWFRIIYEIRSDLQKTVSQNKYNFEIIMENAEPNFCLNW